MESSHLLSGGGISSCCIGGNGEPKSPPPPASVASGLGILTAAVFLVGELAGTGLLAMPKAVLNSGGWPGLVLILIFTLCATYVGIRLGTCWDITAAAADAALESQTMTTILLEAEEEEEDDVGRRSESVPVRDPYPLIAETAGAMVGPRTANFLRKSTILFMLIVTYGSICVFIVLISNFCTDLTGLLSSCAWMVVVTLVLNPFTWFGTPKDFWLIGVMAFVSTTAAVIFVVVQIEYDIRRPGNLQCGEATQQQQQGYYDNASGLYQPAFPSSSSSSSDGLLGWNKRFSAFGTIMFAFGGASLFPTIQIDMKNTQDFRMAVILAMTTLFFLYVPFSSVSYYSLGLCLTDNIIFTLSPGLLRTLAQLVLLVHLSAALPIVINPANQYVEDIHRRYLVGRMLKGVLGIPVECGWKRYLLRSATLMALLFVCESVPNFSSIMDLVGAAFTLLTFIYPPLFYLLLAGKVNPSMGVRRAFPWYEKAFCVSLIFLGTVGGIISTYAAVEKILQPSAGGGDLSKPCYL